MTERKGLKALELWARRMTDGYPGVKVDNMTTSWRDGLAFCAIIHHFRPDLIDFAKLKKDDVYQNNSLAFRVAERHLGIPALLDAEDMVTYTVPDRLSILTYLSQFYQVFVGTQGSPTRIVTKRPSSDRNMVSSASSSPPAKMAVRSAPGVVGSRREPCAKCHQPVFLAERLHVANRLYHRTCFRCARCDNQLSLANCYETETDGQYCCETCPDEETVPVPQPTQHTQIPDQVLSRSLSDEEKSRGLQKFDEDEYSANFETALEVPESPLTKARSDFLSKQIIDELDAERLSVDEEIPPLPSSEPPDIPHVNLEHDPLESLTNEIRNSTDISNSSDIAHSLNKSLDTNKNSELNSSEDISTNEDDSSLPLSSTNESNICKAVSQNDLDDTSSLTKSNSNLEAINPELNNTSKSSVGLPLTVTRVSKTSDSEASLKLIGVLKPLDKQVQIKPILKPVKEETNSEDFLRDIRKHLRPISKMEDKKVDKLTEVNGKTNDSECGADVVVVSDIKMELDVKDDIKPTPAIRTIVSKVDEEKDELKDSDGKVDISIKSDVEINLEENAMKPIPTVRTEQLDKLETMEEIIKMEVDEQKEDELQGNEKVESIEIKKADDSSQPIKIEYPAPPDGLFVASPNEAPHDDADVNSDSVNNVRLRVRDQPATAACKAQDINTTKDTRTSLVKRRMMMFEKNLETVDKVPTSEQEGPKIPKESGVNSEETITQETGTEEIASIAEVRDEKETEITGGTIPEQISDNTTNELQVPVDESIIDLTNESSSLEDSKEIINISSTTETSNDASLHDSSADKSTHIVPALEISSVDEKTAQDETADAQLNDRSVNLDVSDLNDVPQKVLSDSISETSHLSIDSSLLKSDASGMEYPEDLNPFGDDEEDDKVPTKRLIMPEDDLRKPLVTPRASNVSNPFSSDEEVEIRPKGVVRKKIEAPRISLNPFWSDGEEPPDEEPAVKPVPLPRSRGYLSTPEPKPRQTGSIGCDFHGSNSSLSSLNSNFGQTPRKKKHAPPPPTVTVTTTPDADKKSSEQYSDGSPGQRISATPRTRKNRKAPLPPTSTPLTPEQQQNSIVSKEEFKSPAESEALNNSSCYFTATSVNSADAESEKFSKDEKNRNRQSQNIGSPTSDSETSSSLSVPNKSTFGKWKRRKGPAPTRPVPQRRQIKQLPMQELKHELDVIEMQQQGLERQGVKLEQLIREKCEGPECDPDTALTVEVEEMILELFELVNEKNELFRRQAELMYMKRQQRLEEEHADLEYQIRCLMDQPERNKTDSDKAREEELINRLVDVVERRNEIVECLEMDRVREAEEDHSINAQMSLFASKREEDNHSIETPIKLSKKEKKKIKKEKKLKEKGKNLDVDKDIDETESVDSKTKEKKKKKWF